MIYKHFLDFTKNSPFDKLSGDQKRAVETQANIDLEAHKLSRYYKKAIKDEEIENELFKALCKYYAKASENELKKMVILDSKALYYYPLTKNRIEYYEKLAKERADAMDRNIYAQTKLHFKDFSR